MTILPNNGAFRTQLIVACFPMPAVNGPDFLEKDWPEGHEVAMYTATWWAHEIISHLADK